MRIQFLILFLFSASMLFAQSKYMKYGSVPDSDIKMKTYESDPEAEAVVLGDIGYQTFELNAGELNIMFKRHRRIKILTSEGFDFANMSLLYPESSGLVKMKATIHFPDGKKENLKNSAFLKEDVSERTKKVVFTYPGVTEGCVIEYYYELSTGNVGNMKTWFFEDVIPVRYSEYHFGRPEYFQYLLEPRGNMHLAEHNTSTRTESTTNVYSSGGGSGFRDNPNGQTKSTSTKINIQEDQFIMRDRPAFQEEPFMTTITDYLSAMDAQLQTIRWPSGDVDNYIQSWAGLSADLMAMDGFGRQLKVKNLKFDEVPLQGSSQKDKIKSAHAYIAKNMKWDGFVGAIPGKESLKKVFDSQAGSVAQINFLLINLLRAHDIEAYPVLGSTRSNGLLQTSWPFIDQFNYCLVLAIADGKPILMDATDPLLPYNLPDPEALNRKGWLIKDAGDESWINLNVPSSSMAYQISLTIDSEKQSALGKMKVSHSNYYAFESRSALLRKKEADFITNDLIANENLSLSNMVTKEAKSVNKPIKFELDFETEEVVTFADDLIYINPVFVEQYDENPFKRDIRNFPVDIPFPFTETYVFNVNIPEGYAVEEIPKTEILKLVEHKVKFTFSCKESNGKIQIISKLDLKDTFFIQDEYPFIKDFFDKIVEKHASQIVLKKL